MMRAFWILALSVSLANAADGPLKIVCFGDSITEGKTPASLKNGERWIERVQAASGGKWVCINEGKGGRPASAVNELEPALKRTRDAAVLLIALGTNDSRDYTVQSIDHYMSSMTKLIEIAQSENPKLKIVLCAPYNINIDGLKKNQDMGLKRQENLSAYGKVAEKLSADKKCGFINFNGVVPVSSMTTDGVHPDAAGHAAIAEAAAKALKDFLK
jgi:acyl-CoA thioesterase-1